jgi:hypothetical protein
VELVSHRLALGQFNALQTTKMRNRIFENVIFQTKKKYLGKAKAEATSAHASTKYSDCFMFYESKAMMWNS